MIKGTTKRMIIMLLFAALVFGGIYGFQQFRNKMIQKAIKGQGMPPQAVSTIVAQTSAWQPSVEAVGNLRAASGANLAAEARAETRDRRRRGTSRPACPNRERHHN